MDRRTKIVATIGPASSEPDVLARIVDAVLHDQRAVLTVGAPSEDVLGVRDVTISKPRLVGGQGVLETFPLPLNDAESAGLRASAAVIRAALDELGDNV